MLALKKFLWLLAGSRNGLLTVTQNSNVSQAMLLALTSATRQSDLHALDLTFVQFLPQGVEFRIPGLTKTRTPGKDVVFFFPSLTDNLQLCPVACLKEYIKKTEKLHNHSDVSKPLFLATQKPYSPVQSTSIGRQLQLTLQDAGIDTSVFKAHSTRGASSSAARQSGVSVKDILAAAAWSREITFNHVYYRPPQSTSFGRAVISQFSYFERDQLVTSECNMPQDSRLRYATQQLKYKQNSIIVARRIH